MQPVQVEFSSQGSRLKGRFYPTTGIEHPHTLLFVPGWPADPEDFLGLGPLLAQRGINVMEFYPRGFHQSEGEYTHSGGLQDVASAWQWLGHQKIRKKFSIDPTKLLLGGYSNGGGLALAYAARDPNVRRVISVAGTEFTEFAHQLQHDPIFAENIRQWLLTTMAPDGPARFDLQVCGQELIDHPEIFGARHNAKKLADRSILMFGGWEDQGPTVDRHQLPLYRALKSAGAQDVTFIVYHTDHSFSNVHKRLVADIADWILKN